MTARRKGVLILFFDLSTITPKDRRNYRQFMRRIERLGYSMLQESVYIKDVRNIERVSGESQALTDGLNLNGSVYLLPLRINTFSHLISVCGKGIDINCFADDIIII